MHQRSFLFKLTLWAVFMAVLLGAGTVLLRHEFWGILGFWFIVLGVIPWVPGMLFTVPFAVHSHRSLTERPDGRIAISQGELWQSLRGWVIAWLLLGCLAFAGGMHAAPVKSEDSWSYAWFVRGCYGGFIFLFFYAPLIYQAATGLLIARHCRHFGSVLSGMILIGTSTYVIIFLAFFYAIELSPDKVLKSTLPNAGYNPGFPEPESALCYTSILGVGLLCWTMRKRSAADLTARQPPEES